jgi:hypothetical protein
MIMAKAKSKAKTTVGWGVGERETLRDLLISKLFSVPDDGLLYGSG